MQKLPTKGTPTTTSMGSKNLLSKSLLNSLPKSYDEVFRQSLDRRGRVVTAADMVG